MPSPIINRRLNSVPVSIPVLGDVLLINESTDFDGSANGAAIATWFDKSGYGHHWTSTACTVDKTRTANGHATVRFDGATTFMQQPFFFAAGGYTGLEMMVVAKKDVNPPAGGNEGALVEFNHPVNFPSHHPYTDGTFYCGFARTDRPALAIPTTNISTAFRILNLSANSSNTLYNAWLDSENFFTAAGGYTFQQQGLEISQGATTGGPNYSLGRGWRYDLANTFLTVLGNIAAVYCWKKQLSTAERAAMRTYINGLFGTTA